ncbi:hybrid sensor histidine kinase/response regulator transcription factor [Larkinella harenae]
MAQQYAVSVKHYGPENGLSHREVNAILQDRQGFMWFGTKFGLNRFDGKNFTSFTKERNGLPFDDIHSMAEDAQGNLWLSGSTGQSRICIFNPLTRKTVPFEQVVGNQRNSTKLNDLQGLLNSDDGTIFLTNYNPAALITYHPKSGLRRVPLPQFKTLGIFRATARQTVWGIADENRLVELTMDGRILHQYEHGRNIISWCFGQRNAGIEFFYTVYNPAQSNHHTFYSVDEAGHRRIWPTALLESMKRYTGPICYPVTRTGLLWDGITLRDSTNKTIVTIAGQTAGESIENRSFFRDRSGLFWLGTSFGVYQVKLTQNNFQRLVYQENNQGVQTAIRGITVLGDRVYANLEKLGLYTVSQQGGQAQKIYANSVFAYGLAADSQGSLYAGNGNQLLHYKPSSGSYTTLKLPGTSTLWAMHPLGPQHWLGGTQAGLIMINRHSGQLTPFTNYNSFPELAQGHVLHIGPDQQGTLWICATTGLYTIDPVKGVTARYWSGGKSRFHLPADNYQHFYQDPNGIYWLATANSGLIRWDRQQGRFRQFRRAEGLSNDNIYAVYPDQQGKLWMSSDYGIMQFDPVKVTTRTYFVQDGITHNEFNRIAHFQDKTGTIYFGGLNGITAFDPLDFVGEKPSPPLPIQVVSFRQFDQSIRQLIDKTQEVTTTHQIVIQPDDQSAVLEFALLNYTDAEKNAYAYQFKDLDNTWIHQVESSLRLSNLPYGTHELLIRGQAANGQWSANTLTIQVVVVRPFYQQAWFLVSMILLLIASIWVWMRWRTWNHHQEQKRLQQEIRQAIAQIEEDKELIEQQAHMLQRLNESKSRFFANISHEFRTPLTVILGLTSELKRHRPDDPARPGQRAVDLIERNGNNLLRLINQILDLSKIEAGEMRLRLTRSDLVLFCHYIADSFHPLAIQKNIQLHFQSDEETLEADFDSDKLQDVLSNLLSNAIKFTPVGGVIHFRLSAQLERSPADAQGYYEAVAPPFHSADSRLFFTIRDTGPGIDVDQLPRIFNRFFQVSNPSAPEVGGTGIGLALVRELVGLMDGGLAIRSLPGQGTEFIVQLRQTTQAPPAAVPLHRPPSLNTEPLEKRVDSMLETARKKPILLLVEDNEDVATYLRLCLEEKYHIVRADTGQTGIDQAFETIPDLVLSDVMMPQKDGFQLCDELKNDLRTSHIPIVLLTARAADHDRISGLRWGADAYLTKPFQRDELLIVLHNLLQSRRILQQYYSQLALKSVASRPPTITEADSLEELFLQKLGSTIEGQLSNANLSIEEICHQMGMSRTTLHQKLVALTGMPITRYIRVLRLDKAKELLTTTSLNISEVAYAVGFDDPKYFSRVFSEEFKISPLNFRRSALSEQ